MSGLFGLFGGSAPAQQQKPSGLGLLSSLFGGGQQTESSFNGSDLLFQFLFRLATVNVGLGIFNLIPVPPLDGSKVLAEFLPLKARIKFLQFERFGWVVLFFLIYFGNLSKYLGMLLEFVFNLLFNLIAGVII